MFKKIHHHQTSVAPICLPSPDQEFSRVTAFAAGWGRHAPPDISRTQAQKLRFVRLVVSPKRYFTHKMFGTILSKHGNEYKDVCSGDSGKFRDVVLSGTKWRLIPNASSGR